MKIIFLDIEFDDFILATRAVKYLLALPEQKDAIVSYGDGGDFYVRRNKASITVRYVSRDA